MNLQQMRDRLAAIVAQLEQIKALGAELTEQDVDTINDLSSEFEGLSGKIAASEKLEQISAKAATSTRKTETSQPRIEVKASRKEITGGFEQYGDFLMAVKNSALGNTDKRFQNTMFERNGEDGGFLVPDQFISDVAKKMNGDDSLLARTTQFAVSGNNLTLPTDETAPWTGGIQSYWVSEGAPIQDSKHKFGQASWKLHKVAALVKVTDELLEDGLALESYIRSMAPQAIVHKINSAIISGDGVGKPNGILSSGFKVKVAKESLQAADTIVARNLVKMYSRLLPMARRSAVWMINPMVEEQLRLVKDDNDNFIYLAPGSQMNQQPYGLLMGLPVMPMLGSMKELGTEGDIILCDLSYYYAIIKAGGMKQAVSQHLYFDRDIQAFKFVMRLDGGCPFKAPVKTEFGNYEMSAIITLEDR